MAESQKVQYLRQTSTIRAHAQALLARARRGESAYWRVDDDALPFAASKVADTTRRNYPDLRIPYHSRWRHFEAGGVNRRAGLNAQLPADDPSRAIAQIDLTVVSVLLDAGAGAAWAYTENGKSYSRSEGLGVASFAGFCSGLFSTDGSLSVDAARLQTISEADLSAMFQASEHNPIVGLPGRAALMQALGRAVAARPDVFSDAHGALRPGNMWHALVNQNHEIRAHSILSLLLDALGPAWRTPNAIDGIGLGDCWPHPAAPEGWMPFHKLSQWLTYSLLEPFEWAGIQVRGLDELTGLPEYRNGGLMIDTGLIQPCSPAMLQKTWQVSDEAIVEWRALTVALLDEIAPLVRHALGKTAGEMPLACILEGGSWAAGRELARDLRGGDPPITLALDGTVF